MQPSGNTLAFVKRCSDAPHLSDFSIICTTVRYTERANIKYTFPTQQDLRLIISSQPLVAHSKCYYSPNVGATVNGF